MRCGPNSQAIKESLTQPSAEESFCSSSIWLFCLFVEGEL
jgi:hypothetical protein